MEERLKLFLAMEGLSPAQLADRLGVQRSGISHLLQGRNKPSFEFINKMLAEFPKINPDWLIMGTGKAYRDGVAAPIPAVAGQADNASSFDDDLPLDDSVSASADTPINNSPEAFDLFSASFSTVQAPAAPSPAASNDSARLQQATTAITQRNQPEMPAAQPAAYQPVQQPRGAQQAVQEPVRAAQQPSYPSENRINGRNEANSPRFSGQKQIRQIVVFFTDGTYEIR